MNIKIQYQNSIDRQSIIDDNKDKILIEDQKLLNDINFLIFSDIKSLEFQLQDIKDNQNITLNMLFDMANV